MLLLLHFSSDYYPSPFNRILAKRNKLLSTDISITHLDVVVSMSIEWIGIHLQAGLKIHDSDQCTIWSVTRSIVSHNIIGLKRSIKQIAFYLHLFLVLLYWYHLLGTLFVGNQRIKFYNWVVVQIFIALFKKKTITLSQYTQHIDVIYICIKETLGNLSL